MPLIIRDRSLFGSVVDGLLRPAFPPRNPVRLLGVTVSNFDRSQNWQRRTEQMALPIPRSEPVRRSWADLVPPAPNASNDGSQNHQP